MGSFSFHTGILQYVHFATVKTKFINSNWIAQILPERYSGLLELGLLFTGIIIIDGGVNSAYTPFEALLDDMYEDHGGVQRAFGIKTLMVSMGGSLGQSLLHYILKTFNLTSLAYLLCSIDLNKLNLSHSLGGADRLLFLILFFFMISTITISIREIKKSPLTVNIQYCSIPFS